MGDFDAAPYFPGEPYGFSQDSSDLHRGVLAFLAKNDGPPGLFPGGSDVFGLF